jgi:hypothetical protein
MAILSKTTANPKANPMEIPPELRRNGSVKLDDTSTAIIAQLQVEIAALKAKQNNGQLKMKVSEKGALSIYGLQRFPITLYSEQWSRLLAAKGDIEALIEAHKAELSTKGG